MGCLKKKKERPHTRRSRHALAEVCAQQENWIGVCGTLPPTICPKVESNLFHSPQEDARFLGQVYSGIDQQSLLAHRATGVNNA
jgi:hypothetical protein